MLFLATPQLVSHRIDRWSPLFPPACFRARPLEPTLPLSRVPPAPLRPTFPGLVMREDDVDAEDTIDAALRDRRRQAELAARCEHAPAAAEARHAAAGAGLGRASCSLVALAWRGGPT